MHLIDGWDVPFAAAGVTRADGVVATRGDALRAVPLASVSKPVSALATLVAAEEGVVDLDEPAGPPGSTVRHLLAHASGLPFEGAAPIAPPGTAPDLLQRGLRASLGEHVGGAGGDAVRRLRARRRLRAARDRRSTRQGMPAAACTRASTTCSRSGASCSPRASSLAETHDEMVAVQFPGLDGVLPEFGRFSPLDWGLGVELKGAKEGHWSGSLTSPRLFGHFGGSGTFLWVDPVQGLACAALTTRRFGDWAKVAWPLLSDAVVRAVAQSET